MGLTIYRGLYEISPVYLVGGIAEKIPGGVLPIAALTEALSAGGSILTGNFGDVVDFDRYFAHWSPVYGSQWLSYDVASYPMFSQQEAANSIVKNPLNISLMMDCPAQKTGGLITKALTLEVLRSTLAYHVDNGGYFNIFQFGFTALNCLLLGMESVENQSKQDHVSFIFNFRQQLLTRQDAQKLSDKVQNMNSGLPQNSGASFSGWKNAVLGGVGL